VSRCQRLALRPLTAGEVKQDLRAAGVEAERAALAGRLAVGGQIRAEDVVDEGFDSLRETVERFIDAALHGREDDYWDLLEAFGGRPDKQRMEGFLELCSTYLRDVLLMQMERAQGVVHSDRSTHLSAWQGRLPERGLDHAARMIDEAYDGLMRNVSPQLLLADLWYQLRRSGAAAG
jgi:hypothetical protein